MIKNITSRENPLIKYACSLKQPKVRKEHQQFLAESLKTLELAIRSRLVREVFTLEELKNLPDSVHQYLVTPEIMDKIAFSAHPEGVVFISDFLATKKPSVMQKAIYLDHISDPGNMGTLIRTALAFDYDAVILSPDCVSVYNEKVIAASKGALFLLPIFEDDLLNYSKEYTIVVSDLSDESLPLEEAKVDFPFILVVGNEAHGISPEMKKIANLSVKIPMKHIDSLNVSIAAGILMYHFH